MLEDVGELQFETPVFVYKPAKPESKVTVSEEVAEIS
jgi:hypothetical protein